MTFQGSMQVQTDAGHTNDASIGADFGPGKPRRVDFRDENEYEPLLISELPLGSDNFELKKADKICDNFVEDEATEFKYEGTDSLATSLSSLNTDVSDRDWEETFRVLGPEFAEMLSGEMDSDSDDSSGTEI